MSDPREDFFQMSKHLNMPVNSSSNSSFAGIPQKWMNNADKDVSVNDKKIFVLLYCQLGDGGFIWGNGFILLGTLDVYLISK